MIRAGVSDFVCSLRGSTLTTKYNFFQPTIDHVVNLFQRGGARTLVPHPPLVFSSILVYVRTRSMHVTRTFSPCVLETPGAERSPNWPCLAHNLTELIRHSSGALRYWYPTNMGRIPS